MDDIADLTMIFLHVSDDCPPPVASFYWDPVPACVGQPICFWDTSTKQPISWLWNFGGLGTRVVQHPSFTFYAANSYLVQLSASNSCGIDLAAQRVPVIECDGQPDIDIYVKDRSTDDGSVPSSSPWWVSPDIWVRLLNDGGTIHQDPIPGAMNTVMTRVRNRMATADQDVTVSLYWAPTTPPPTWPGSWHPIGSVLILNIPAGSSVVASLPWNTPLLTGNVSLLARASSANDPVAFGPDTVSPAHIAPSNNNIAQKDVQITGPEPSSTPSPTPTRPNPSGYRVYLPLVMRTSES